MSTVKPITLKHDGTLPRVEWTYEIPTKAAVVNIIPLVAAFKEAHEAQAVFSRYYDKYHGPVLMDVRRVTGKMAKKGKQAIPGQVILVMRWRGTSQMADRLSRIDARFHRTDPEAM